MAWAIRGTTSGGAARRPFRSIIPAMPHIPLPQGGQNPFRERGSRPGVAANRDQVEALGRRLLRSPPRAVLTCARGSSDHAATFAKYLIETRAGTIVASAAPSVSSIYGAAQRVDEEVSPQ